MGTVTSTPHTVGLNQGEIDCNSLQESIDVKRTKKRNCLPPCQVSAMGNEVSSQQTNLREMQSRGTEFPGSDYHPTDRKNWMAGLGPERIHVNQIVWPGTHNSATNEVGNIFSRPYAECQTLSIYQQLVLGTRTFDIRVREDRIVCHGTETSYSVDVVINDVKKFMSETLSEIIILEIRTEFGHQDPPEFDKYLESQLGGLLIHQNDSVFGKRIIDLLPKRVICIWKPRNSPQPRAGGPLWGSGHLKDNWTNTDLPLTKFDNNLMYLKEQQPVSSRTYFYRVEHTLTAQPDKNIPLMVFLPMAIPDTVWVRPVTNRIRWYARLFIAHCFSQGVADRLQVFSCDFIDEDFVDACVGVTYARIEGRA